MAEPASRETPSLSMRMVWLIALVTIAASLGALAHWQVTTRLDELANQRIADIAHGLPIQQWKLTKPEDIIAGRVFGNATTSFDESGLHITSRGIAVEFGLPLAEPLDLDRYGLVELAVQADPAVRLQWSAYFQNSSSPCRSELQAIVDGILRSRLRRIDWACVLPARPSAVSLRLVVDGPAGAKVTLSDARILPIGNVSRPQPNDVPIIRTSSDIPAAASALLALPQNSQLVANVPLGWRDAAGLDRRAQLRDLVPGVVTATAPNLRGNHRVEKAIPDAYTLSLFGVLLLIWRWPPRTLKWRIPAQIAAALLMPLWLSVGLRLGTPFSWIDQSFIAAGSIYLTLRLVEHARRWNWIGAPSAWVIPAVSIVLAVALAMALHGRSEVIYPDAVKALRYLGWAAIQQLVLSRVVADRLTALGWSVPWVSLSAATTFALLHAPNQSLMLLTLIGGLLWMWSWQRHRALLPNVVAHALCGLIASAAIDRSWLWSAEVGSRFFAG